MPSVGARGRRTVASSFSEDTVLPMASRPLRAPRTPRMNGNREGEKPQTILKERDKQGRCVHAAGVAHIELQ